MGKRATTKSPDTLAFAREHRKLGWSFKQIADALSVAPGTLTLWLADTPAQGTAHLRGEARSRLSGKGLTEADVRAIRVAEGRLVDIGKTYGISAAMVCHIRQRRKWAHVQ